MAAIMPLDRAAERFVRRAAGAGADYEAGVKNPSRPWDQAAAGAEENYKARVTDAATKGLFGRGIRRAGNAKWQNRAVALGVGRFGPGVAAASPDWIKGFAPFHQAISAVQLQPRRPRRDPGNRQRINQILDAVVATAQAQERTA